MVNRAKIRSFGVANMYGGCQVPTTIVDTTMLGLPEERPLPWLHHPLPTAGIVYVDLTFDLAHVDAEDVSTHTNMHVCPHTYTRAHTFTIQ